MHLIATNEPTQEKLKRLYSEAKGFLTRNAKAIGSGLVIVISAGCAAVIITAFYEITIHEELIRILETM